MSPTHADFHWLVGLIEGEGSFIKGPPSKPNIPIVVVTTSDRDIADRAADLIGVGVLTKTRSKTPDHYKTIYWVRAHGGRAIALMNALHPYMGERRQKQIEGVLASTKQGRHKTSFDRVPVLQEMT